MADVVKVVVWGCMLVCVALIGVGVFLFYMIRSVFRDDEEEERIE